MGAYLERVMGIEPTQPAWKAGILPLNYTRILERKTGFEPATFALARRRSTTEPLPLIYGASGQNRTTDTQIFSLLLYRLSYRGIPLFIMATRKGLEPSTSSVTGWHSNQLNYRAMWWAFRDLNPGPTGYEPAALTN